MCEQNKFTNNVSWLGDPWLKRITLVNAGSVPTFFRTETSHIVHKTSRFITTNIITKLQNANICNLQCKALRNLM